MNPYRREEHSSREVASAEVLKEWEGRARAAEKVLEIAGAM